MTTDAATGISPTGATLEGTVNPNGDSATAYFQWGETTTYGRTTADQDMGSGTSAVSLSQPLSNLACNTTYHYRAVCANGGDTIYGGDKNLKTSTCSGAINMRPTSAILELLLSSEQGLQPKSI